MLLTPDPHGALQAPSPWIVRWSHLVPPAGAVLDVACGAGRHMRWFADRGHPTTGVDRSEDAVQAASRHGRVLQADIEGGPWPFEGQRFAAVVVTNYLWRPRLPDIVTAVAPGGVLLYETFAAGNETVGKPSRADFLLQPGELLAHAAAAGLRVIAFEEGHVGTAKPAVIQRICAVGPAFQLANVKLDVSSRVSSQE